MGNSIADFYCHALKLVIEVDGSIHNLEDVKDKDEEKDRFLESKGLKVIQFTNHAIEKQFEYVVLE